MFHFSWGNFFINFNLKIVVSEIYFHYFEKKLKIKMRKHLKKIDQKRLGYPLSNEYRDMVNNQITKTLGIPESTNGYYRKRPNNLICERSPKLPKK